MRDDIETGLFDRSNTRSAGMNRHDAKLFETLERFSDRASMHTEALRQISFRGQSLATPVLASKDVVAKTRRDGRIL